MTQQEDYLMKQVDQLGKVLGRLLATLTGYQGVGRAAEPMEFVAQVFVEELDLDITKLLDMSADDFAEALLGMDKINIENLDTIAAILLVLADEKQDKDIYWKCLELYTYIENKDKCYSLERSETIHYIRRKLTGYNR